MAYNMCVGNTGSGFDYRRPDLKILSWYKNEGGTAWLYGEKQKKPSNILSMINS
jgi:hypothetical protein